MDAPIVVKVYTLIDSIIRLLKRLKLILAEQISLQGSVERFNVRVLIWRLWWNAFMDKLLLFTKFRKGFTYELGSVICADDGLLFTDPKPSSVRFGNV
jgi:hypothetical protein